MATATDQRPRAAGRARPAAGERRPGRRRVLLRRVAVGSAAAAVFLGCAGAWVVYASPFTDLRTVEVVGAPPGQIGAIRTDAALPLGEALASVELDPAASRVAARGDVRDVTVTRQWPHTVVVTVVPRTVVGVLPAGGGVKLVGSDGTSMGAAAQAPIGLPVVKASGDDRTRAAGALGSLSPETLALVDWAQVRGGNIELMLRDGRGFVLWGGADQSAVKGKTLGVLLASDEDARWFDLSRAGTPRTRTSAPVGALPAGAAPTAAASPAPGNPSDPSAAQQQDATPETGGESPVVPSPQVVDPAAPAVGGERPAGLVPVTG